MKSLDWVVGLKPTVCLWDLSLEICMGPGGHIKSDFSTGPIRQMRVDYSNGAGQLMIGDFSNEPGRAGKKTKEFFNGRVSLQK